MEDFGFADGGVCTLTISANVRFLGSDELVAVSACCCFLVVDHRLDRCGCSLDQDCLGKSSASAEVPGVDTLVDIVGHSIPLDLRRGFLSSLG